MEGNLKNQENSVLVLKFSASWCGPCKMLGKIFHEIDESYPNITFVEVDVDEAESELIQEYGVMSVPKTIIFKNNVVVDTFLGAVPKTTLLKKLEDFK